MLSTSELGHKHECHDYLKAIVSKQRLWQQVALRNNNNASYASSFTHCADEPQKENSVRKRGKRISTFAAQAMQND